MTETTPVVVIDDDVAFADALGLAISLTPHLDVIGHAHHAEDGYRLVLDRRPGLVVCDYRLRQSETGVDCLRRIRRAGVMTPAVVLTAYLAPKVEREVDTLPLVFALSKQQRIKDLITQFGEVVAGVYRPSLERRSQVLSDGEFEVLEAINAGVTAAAIADEQLVSIHTVRSRIKSLMRKLDVSSQVEAVAEATRMGLLVPPS